MSLLYFIIYSPKIMKLLKLDMLGPSWPSSKVLTSVAANLLEHWKYVWHVCSSTSIWHNYKFSSYIREIMSEKCDSKLMPWRTHVGRAHCCRGNESHSLNGSNKIHTSIHLFHSRHRLQKQQMNLRKWLHRHLKRLEFISFKCNTSVLVCFIFLSFHFVF